MKGIVFNLLEQAVSSEHGEDLWDDLLDEAGLDGAFTSLGDYADSQFFALRRVASKALALTEGDFERWFGSMAIPRLAKSYPELFEPHRSAHGLVLALNSIIHPEVRKLYPGADVPVFGYEVASDQVVSVRYRSTRKMCAFAEGLIQGAATHFSERVVIEQTTCMHRGDEECTLVCRFARTSADA